MPNIGHKIKNSYEEEEKSVRKGTQGKIQLKRFLHSITEFLTTIIIFILFIQMVDDLKKEPGSRFTYTLVGVCCTSFSIIYEYIDARI